MHRLHTNGVSVMETKQETQNLRDELEAVKLRARTAAQWLRDATPDANAGPTNVDEYARRAVAHIDTLTSQVGLLRKALCDTAPATEGDLPCWCYPNPVLRAGVFVHHPLSCAPRRALLETIKDKDADHA